MCIIFICCVVELACIIFFIKNALTYQHRTTILYKSYHLYDKLSSYNRMLFNLKRWTLKRKFYITIFEIWRYLNTEAGESWLRSSGGIGRR